MVHRNRGMVRESTIRDHPLQRHRTANTKPLSRTLRSYSSGRVRRHKAHIEPRHTSVMVDRDTHGRIMEGRAIPKRGPPNTIGTGVTNSMTSPHRSPKTRPKGDRKHHTIMVSLSRTREPHRKQPLRMLNQSSVTNSNMQHMFPS